MINKINCILLTEFKVTSAETDMYKRLKLGSLFNYLIQSATRSADRLGFGYENLKEQNLFWVLSRFSVEIYRPLMWNEEITVETWPKDIRGIFYIRDFILKDKKNSIIGKATSGWLAIDFETKRPARIIDSINSNIFTDLKDKHGIKDSPEKLTNVVKGDIFEIESGYYDIDLNKHVTSTRYIDWMMDTFTLEHHQDHYPKKLSVNYVKETKPKEKLSIKRETFLKNKFLFEGTNLNNGMTSFRGRIDF